MKQITEAQIQKIMPRAKREHIKDFVRTFNTWAPIFRIDTPLRVVHFLGQVAHESVELSAMTENLNYSADGLRKTFPKYFPTTEEAMKYARKPEKIANRVYANRVGNGNEDSGDGWKYRGRGLIQLTGRSNYQAYQDSGYCIGDLMGHTEWLESYPGALKSAMWFWHKNDLNKWADMDNIEKVTKTINGGLHGLAKRSNYVRLAKRVFC